MSDPNVLTDPRLYTTLGRIESSILDRQPLREEYRENKDDGLTIFIPNWNHRSFLPRALRSALDALGHLKREGYSAEILVIDDASRDGSQKFLQTVQALYNEPRLKTVCLKQNLGLTRLRNLALLMARFRYVCLMDSDNELIPRNLTVFLRSILETDATLVYGNLIDNQHRDATGIRSNMPATLRLMTANYIDAFSIVDAEKILRLGGYARIHPYCPDDWEMNLHLIAEEASIVFVPAVLGYYHKQQLSGSEENVPFAQGANAALRRVYAQTGLREWDNMRVGRIYHPDVGYVDQW